jgi:predicted dehydrogenase
MLARAGVRVPVEGRGFGNQEPSSRMRTSASIGLVGVGGYARNHIRVLERLQAAGAARLVAAVARSPQKHPDAVRRFRKNAVELFADAPEMFVAMRDRLDVVSIVTGIDSHAPLTMAAMQNGYAVLLDKPPAATIQDLDAMLAVEAQTGQPCAVLLQWLSFPPYRALKELVVSGRMGRAIKAKCMVGEPRATEYYARNDWAGRWEVDGRLVLDGPLKNALLHDLNTLLYVCSRRPRGLLEPVSAMCEMYRAHSIEGEDTSCLRLQCEDDTTIHFYGTHACMARWRAMEIEFENGSVIEQRSGPLTRVFVRHHDGGGDTFEGHNDQDSLITAFYANLIRCIAGVEERLYCPLALTRPLVLATNGAHMSAGRPVPIPPEHVHRESAPRRHWTGDGRTQEHWVGILGIQSLMAEAYRREVLFSEMDVPWACARPTASLAGMRRLRLD